MPTLHAFIFFGQFFPDNAAAERFLKEWHVHVNCNRIEDAPTESLGLQMLTDGRAALGFRLVPGQSDADARDMWSHRVLPYCTSSDSHLVVYASVG